MSGGVAGLLRDKVRALAPRGVGARLKLARLALEKRVFRRRVDHAQFRDALKSLGEWSGRPVWVQASLNDFYNVDLRPSEIIELMLDLAGPRGTVIMPAFPLNPDPDKVLAIDTVPSQTGMLTEMFRRTAGAHRSVHLYSSVAAVGADAAWLTDGHHLDPYPWGEQSPYGRLVAADGLMVGLGIVPLGLTPLHNVECVLHHEVPRFARVFPGDVATYAWRRRNGETGVHTTLLRKGDIHPARLLRHLPSGLLKRFRVSNLSVQGASAAAAVDALKALAHRNKTIYQGD